MFCPILIDTTRHGVVSAGEILPFDEEPNLTRKIKGFTPVWPIRKDGSLGNWGVVREFT
jgi:hypothetical protein